MCVICYNVFYGYTLVNRISKLYIILCFFFVTDTASTEIYTYCHTLSLHDALPISLKHAPHPAAAVTADAWEHKYTRQQAAYPLPWVRENKYRSEEHTSELQSLMRISYAVFCLKKQTTHTP